MVNGMESEATTFKEDAVGFHATAPGPRMFSKTLCQVTYVHSGSISQSRLLKLWLVLLREKL